MHKINGEVISEGHTNLWDAILPELRSQLGDITHRNWIRHLRFDGVIRAQLLLAAPTKFIAQWIDNNYSDTILLIARQVDDSIRSVMIDVDSTMAAIAIQKASNENPNTEDLSEEECDIFDYKLDPRFSFESFAQGASNKLALSSVRAVADGRMSNISKVVYIHSSVGQGKTHLLQSVARRIKGMNDGRKVLYLSAEKFMHLYIKYTRGNNLISFKEKIKSCDVLIIDDLQFICGKTGTQQEFGNLLTALTDSNKVVLLSADVSPFSLELDVRSKSRLIGGVVAEISDPDFDLRMAVLRCKIKAANVDISDPVLEMIASTIVGSNREIEGALNKLIAYANFEGVVPDLALATSLLQINFNAGRTSRLSLSSIIQAVSAYYNVSVDSMKSKSRSKTLILPRQVFATLAKELTSHSLQEIGLFLGKRDHASIIYYVKQVRSKSLTDPSIKTTIDEISKRC